MIYYWILFLVILFVISVGKGEKPALVFSLLLFFLFFAFRIGFTPDYYNYENIFNQFHNSLFLESDDRVEIGFQWLCMVLPSYRALLIVYTTFFCICTYLAMQYIHRRFWVLAFTMLFCYTPFVLGNMSGLRSGFVTCIFFIAILLKARFNKFVGIPLSISVFCFAYLFHKSSIVLFPLLLISKRPLGNKYRYILDFFVAIIIIVSFLFADKWNQVALSISDQVFENNHYSVYFDNNEEYHYNVFLIVKHAAVITLLYITLQFIQKEKCWGNIVFLKYTVFFYLIYLLPSSLGLISRFYYYFAFPCIIGTSYLIGGVVKKVRQIYLFCIFIIIIWMLLFFYRSVAIDHFMKYDNILF